MKDPCKYKGQKILLVEGKNDCHVILALCKAHKVPETFGIFKCGSDEKVLKQLNARISQPEPPTTIGVVLDVDDMSIDRRWQSFKSKLKDYPYIIPVQPNEEGTIIDEIEGEPKYPKLGIWLMPNNKNTGMLEDFCHSLVEPDSLEFAEKCVDNAKEKGITTFKDNHKSKAVIHTYLAWQDEPGNPLGTAITAKALQADKPIAKKFTQWLTNLFV